RRRTRQVLVAVTHHRLPARRVLHAVVHRIEIPGAVVGGLLQETLALVAPGEALRGTQALDAGGEAGTEELEQQGVLGVPAGLRLAEKQRHEPGPATVHIETDQEDGATA